MLKGTKREPKENQNGRRLIKNVTKKGCNIVTSLYCSILGAKMEPKGSQKGVKGEPKRAPVDSRLGYRHLPMALTSWGNYGQVQNENRLKATSFKNKRKLVKSDIVRLKINENRLKAKSFKNKRKPVKRDIV